MQPTKLSILEIIIHRRALILRHTLLLSIHLRNLPTTRRLIHLLIIPNLDKPRKPQTNPLFARRINALLTASLVPWTERQVRRPDFPHVARLKPHVRLVLAARGVRVEWLGAVDYNLG